MTYCFKSLYFHTANVIVQMSGTAYFLSLFVYFRSDAALTCADGLWLPLYIRVLFWGTDMTRLHYVLKQMSISGKELAKMSGMSCSSIYKYLSGNRKLSLKTARKIANVLNVAPEELVGDA